MPEPIAEVENLLVDGPEVSRANRQWRFPGTALVGGICVMAAIAWFGRTFLSAPDVAERNQAHVQRHVSLAALDGAEEDGVNSILKKAQQMEQDNPVGPSPLEKQYAAAQAQKEAAEKLAAAKAAQAKAAAAEAEDAAAKAAAAAAAHHAAVAKAAPVAPAKAAVAEGCETATPGDTCYKAVLWAKWIGLVEHPDWYPGLNRATANRKAIQEWLHKHKQGSCKKPCAGGKYPVPPVSKGKPTLFCLSVARMGPEMDTMFMQRQIGAGIFSCDHTMVYSDTHVDIDGIATTIIPSTASGVSTDKTAANSQVFMNTWMNLLTKTEWYKYDFIAKVDPDCVFFPARLRGHVHSYTGQNVFFLNCGKYIPATMYGALEVYSKSSLGAYLSAHHKCEQSFPFGAWGEDKYMTNCLEMLGCKAVVDFGNFLHDERCWGVDCGNKQAVAFHAFKDVNHWYNCWLVSNHHGF